jgi:hypothetical protein
MKLPLWQYGKPRPEKDGKRGAYRMLGAAPEFSGRHLDILRRVAESTAWRPDAGTPRLSVSACWPLGGNDWLLFRFLDDGVDDYFRPNTMRIEAALAEDVPWDAVSGWLRRESWPEPAPDGARAIVLPPVPPAGDRPRRPAGPCLYGDAGELDSPLFQAAASCAGERRFLAKKERLDAPAYGAIGSSSMSDRQKKALFWKVSAAAAAVLILTQAYSLMALRELRGNNDSLELVNGRQRAAMESMRSELEGEKEANRKKEETIRALAEKVSELEQNSLNTLSRELTDRYTGSKRRLIELQEKMDFLGKELDGLEEPLRAFGETLKMKTAAPPGSAGP